MPRGIALARTLTATFLAAIALPGPSVAAAVSEAPLSASARTAERTFARSVTPISAAEVTADLRGTAGKRVSFVCSVLSIVDPGTLIGQCGKAIEPVDLYVLMPTAHVRTGQRLHVLGEMAPPSVWVDVNGHSWYTGFVKAHFVDPL